MQKEKGLTRTTEEKTGRKDRKEDNGMRYNSPKLCVTNGHRQI